MASSVESVFRHKDVRNLCIALGVLVLTSMSAISQVIIKERVEIVPGSKGFPRLGGANMAESFYTPCNPPPSGDTVRLAVFYGDSVSLWHITCPGCQDHRMGGSIAQGAAFVRLTLNLPPDPDGGEINGTSFHFREAWGYYVTVHFDQQEPADYALVKISMAYLDFPPPNETYVEVYVVNPSYRVTAELLGPTVTNNSLSEIRLGAGAPCVGVYPDPVTFTASILSGSQWGSFVNPVTHDTSTTISGLPSYNNAPELYFVANGANPDTTAQVRIRFTASVAEVLPLDTVLTVKRNGSRLVIIDHAPHELWPFLPPTKKLKTSRGADRPGYNSKRSFVIEVRDSLGQPVMGDSVKIRSRFIALTGGHQHNSPLLQDSSQGKFYRGGIRGNPFILTTDSSGRAVVDSFITSQFSGQYLITAFMAADTTIKDTVQLKVLVPDLINFATIQSNFWNTTGNINPPGSCPGVSTVVHPSSHFVTQETSDSLQLGLLRFYAWSGSSKGVGQYVVLGVNDMSLQWGGVFDACGRWVDSTYHVFHRVGTSVDIDNNGLKTYPDPVNQKNGVLTRRGRNLREILESREIGGRMYVEPPIHFGFDRGR